MKDSIIMNTFKILTLTAFATFADTASAQFSNTPTSSSRLSSANTSINIKDNNNGYNRFSVGYIGVKLKFHGITSDPMNGFTVGYTRGINLVRNTPLFFEIGTQCFYTMSSYYDEDYSYTETDRRELLVFSVPLNFTYKQNFGEGLYIAPYAGIHFDFGIFFREKETIKGPGFEEHNTYNFYSKKDTYNDPFNRFQMGYQAGVNIGFKKFNISAGYKASFLPIYSDEDGEKTQAGGPVVTIGYNF